MRSKFVAILVCLFACPLLMQAAPMPAPTVTYSYELVGINLCSVTTSPCPNGDTVGTVSGYITVTTNFTTLTVDNAYVVVTGGTGGSPSNTYPSITYIYDVAGQTTNVTSTSGNGTYVRLNIGSADQLQFSFTSLTANSGGSHLNDSSSSEHDAKGNRYMDSGYLLGPTPEPGSLALVGTGMLGCAGFIRRRLRAA